MSGVVNDAVKVACHKPFIAWTVVGCCTNIQYLGGYRWGGTGAGTSADKRRGGPGIALRHGVQRDVPHAVVDADADPQPVPALPRRDVRLGHVHLVDGRRAEGAPLAAGGEWREPARRGLGGEEPLPIRLRKGNGGGSCEGGVRPWRHLMTGGGGSCKVRGWKFFGEI